MPSPFIGAAAFACMVAATSSAAAVDIACVSVIGDALTAIEREPISGTNVPKRRGVANPEPVRARDKVAARAAMSAISARDPSATVATVEVSGAGTEPFFSTPLASINDEGAAALYGQLASGIARQVDAKRVLVIAKLEFRHWSEPYVLAGIGVFADAGPRDMPLNEEAVARRYLAPYVGAALLLFNADGRLIAAQPVTVHATYRSEHGKDIPATPWRILSPEALDVAVNRLIVDGITLAAPRLPL